MCVEHNRVLLKKSELWMRVHIPNKSITGLCHISPARGCRVLLEVSRAVCPGAGVKSLPPVPRKHGEVAVKCCSQAERSLA